MLRTAQLARQNTAQTWHPAIGLPVLASLSKPSFLDVSACQGEDSDMAEQDKNDTPSRYGTLRPSDGSSQAIPGGTLRSAEQDTIEGVSFTTLGERIDYACKSWITAERPQEELARQMGVSRQQIIKMRDHDYGRRGMNDYTPLKRLAVLSGLSYEWLRDGKGKQPRKLTEAEGAQLWAELDQARSTEGKSSQRFIVQEVITKADAPQEGSDEAWPEHVQIDPELMTDLLNFFTNWWKEQGGIEGSPVPIAAACQIYPQLHGGSIMDGRSKLQAFVKFLAIARK